MEKRTSEAEPRLSISRLLRARAGVLVDRWERRVLEDPPPGSSPALREQVPDLIDWIAGRLGRDAGDPAGASARTWEVGASCNMVATLREISHLRAAILELCADEGEPLEGEPAILVHAAIDGAMAAVAGTLEREARAVAERERERLDLTLRLLPVGVCIADARGRILTMNDAALRIWGQQAHLAESAADYHVYVAYRPGATEPIAAEDWGLARVLRGESPEDEDVEVVSTDGERRMIVNSARTLRDAAGNITGGVAVNVDITDRKRAELERAHEAEFRERFIGMLGHDLRTPLGAISFTARSLLAQEEPRADGSLHALERIVQSADRMERMIRDLLDFARSRQRGGFPVKLAPGDLATICAQILDEIKLTHPARVVDLHCRGNARGWWDGDRIAQVAQNLIVNALDYSPPGSKVEVTLDAAGDHIILAVKNEGPPIPPDLIGHIGDPFRRAADASSGRRASQGLGLGLYIAHEIVRAHHGRLRVESSEGQGTTVFVELPRTQPQAA
jgi:PAS domain S-box-containing protein